MSGELVFDGHHAADYMVYAHLQLAQDAAARQAMAISVARPAVDNFAAAYAYAAMPARLRLEAGDWTGAAALPLDPKKDAYPGKYPQSEAINAFARGIGTARSGNAPAAREEQARLLALRDAARAAQLGYWAGQIDIQAAVVAALALCAEGKSDACITELKAAAAREDATEKHVVTPGPLLPARELLAETLLASKPVKSLAKYEAVMKKEPNRYRAIAGAMAAVGAAGDDKRARALAADLVKLGAELVYAAISACVRRRRLPAGRQSCRALKDRTFATPSPSRRLPRRGRGGEKGRRSCEPRRDFCERAGPTLARPSRRIAARACNGDDLVAGGWVRGAAAASASPYAGL